MPFVTPTPFTAGILVVEAGLDNLSDNLTTGVFRPLAETTLGAAAASVTFSAIPATFRNLVVMMLARGTTAASAVSVLLRPNADATAANYHSESLHATGTGALSAAEQAPGALAGLWIGDIPAASAGSSIMYGGFETRLFDYRSGAEKVAISSGSSRFGGASSNRAYCVGSVWNQATVISSLVLLPLAGSFEANSRFTLYGEPALP